MTNDARLASVDAFYRAKVADGRFSVKRKVPTNLSGKTVLRVLDRTGEVLARATVRVVRRNAA